MCVLSVRRTRPFARNVRTKNLTITLNITISIRESRCPITSMLLQYTNLSLQIKTKFSLTSVAQESTFRILGQGWMRCTRRASAHWMMETLKKMMKLSITFIHAMHVKLTLMRCVLCAWTAATFNSALTAITFRVRTCPNSMLTRIVPSEGNMGATMSSLEYSTIKQLIWDKN